MQDEEPRTDGYRHAVQPQYRATPGVPERKPLYKKKLKKTREELELLKDELDMVKNLKSSFTAT